jgi:hypothetical protein
MRFMRHARTGWLGAAAALVVVLTSCSFLTGPVLGPGTIGLGTGVDPALLGYQRTEFFLTGVAQSYTPTARLTTNGKWTVRPAATVAGFKTRVVTYRPTDASKFSGTVIVEWLNVSAGVDLANDWVMAHNELVRHGDAYVGVSAQAVGVNALKTSQPDRYGSLNHPGDSYSYDIFTQAALRIRDNAAAVLDGLKPKRIIATGESQSAFRLVTYIDAVQPIAHAYDGFMVHSRFASGSALTQAPLPAVVPPSPLKIRNDLDVPVMVVEAEGDVIGSNLGARQPDTSKFREWEIAGTSHADSYTINIGFGDAGDGQGASKMFALMRNPQSAGCASPVNAGPHHWVLDTAFHDLDRWVRTGVAPPVGKRLKVASSSPVVLVRDAHGNALGGVRTPQVDAPVATLTGINSGSGFCTLFGSTTPLSTAQLTALYPTHADFVAKWKKALTSAVAKGFILPADKGELLAAARNSTVPN